MFRKIFLNDLPSMRGIDYRIKSNHVVVSSKILKNFSMVEKLVTMISEFNITPIFSDRILKTSMMDFMMDHDITLTTLRLNQNTMSVHQLDKVRRDAINHIIDFDMRYLNEIKLLQRKGYYFMYMPSIISCKDYSKIFRLHEKIQSHDILTMTPIPHCGSRDMIREILRNHIEKSNAWGMYLVPISLSHV